MSVATNASRVVYYGDGSTVAFDFHFRIWNANQAKVFINTGAGDVDVTAQTVISLHDNGGTATFVSAPPAGSAIAILRDMPFTQEDEYSQSSRLDPAELEERLDMDCAERQQLYDAVSRAIKMPATSGATPEEYEAGFLGNINAVADNAASRINNVSAAALSEIAQKSDAAAMSRDAAAQSAQMAKASEDGAGLALAQARNLLAGDISAQVKQALDAAGVARGYAADIEGAVLDAAEKAAACIIARLEGTASICEQFAIAAADSSCEAATSNEKTWKLVREMTGAAAEQAVICIVDQCRCQAKISNANALAAAASAQEAGVAALSARSVIQNYAVKAAADAAAAVTGCITDICTAAADLCMSYSQSAANSAVSACVSADDVRVMIDAYARRAAEETAACCQESFNECLEVIGGYTRRAQRSAEEAERFLEELSATDLCREAEIRRAADEALAKKIEDAVLGIMDNRVAIADEAGLEYDMNGKLRVALSDSVESTSSIQAASSRAVAITYQAAKMARRAVDEALEKSGEAMEMARMALENNFGGNGGTGGNGDNGGNDGALGQPAAIIRLADRITREALARIELANDVRVIMARL